MWAHYVEKWKKRLTRENPSTCDLINVAEVSNSTGLLPSLSFVSERNVVFLIIPCVFSPSGAFGMAEVVGSRQGSVAESYSPHVEEDLFECLRNDIIRLQQRLPTQSDENLPAIVLRNDRRGFQIQEALSENQRKALDSPPFASRAPRMTRKPALPPECVFTKANKSMSLCLANEQT